MTYVDARADSTTPNGIGDIVSDGAASPDAAVGSTSLPVKGLAVCPSLFNREGMIRLLERLDGDGTWYAAPSIEVAVRFYRAVRTQLVWVHELADPHFRFVGLFTEGRRADAVAVLLETGPDATQRANLAFRAGATAVFDSSSPDSSIVSGLRTVLRGSWYVSPSLRSRRTSNGLAGSAVGVGLTGRECQVLQLMAEGLQNKEIAETLVINVETVRTHVKHAMRKLNAGNRTEVVARAFCLHILRPENFQATLVGLSQGRSDAEPAIAASTARKSVVDLPPPDAGDGLDALIPDISTGGTRGIADVDGHPAGRLVDRRDGRPMVPSPARFRTRDERLD